MATTNRNFRVKNGLTIETLTTSGVLVNDTSGNITSSSTITLTGNISADQVLSTNNGNGTNFKVGDDAWIGDINVANTVRVKGQQNSNNGYIVFGDSDAKALGRAGTGRLTYDSGLVPARYYKIIATDNTSLINTSGGVAATYSAFGTNGISLAAGAYEIEMVLLVAATTASNSCTLVVTPGSATGAAVPSSTQLYYDYSDSTTVMTNAAATSAVLRTGTTTFPALNTITIATGTTRYLKASVKGITNISTAGNFTIRLAFTPGAGGSVTGTIYAGSYLKITPLGAEGVTDIGTWA